MAEKSGDIEQPIPKEWRSIIVKIVEDIRNGDLCTESTPEYVIDVDSRSLEWINESVSSYGDTVTSLPEETWNTSVCRWMGNHWHLLIDLFTEDEGSSDLVLFIDVFDEREPPCFKVLSVHVP